MDAVLLDTCVLLKSYLCDTPMTNHPKDRYVLAAAVAGRADILVTENLRDFPSVAVDDFGIIVVGQDDFLSGLLEL